MPGLSPVLEDAPSADQNNYSPTNLAYAEVLRVAPTATISLTGLAATYGGHRLTLVNAATGFHLLLPVESGSSTAGNRFVAPIVGMTELQLPPGDAVQLLYDGTSSRWRPLGWTPREYLIRQDSSYTLTSSTSAQKLFSTTNGALTLPTGVYEFRALIALTSMSGTSGNATFDLGGTATRGSILWRGFGRDAASDAATGTLAGSYSTDATLVAAPLITAATTTAAWFELAGTFKVTAAGTVIPRILLQTAAAAVVAAGSFMAVKPLYSTGTIGLWS